MLKFLKNSKKIGKKILTRYLFLAYAIMVLSTSYFAYLSYYSYLDRKELEMEASTYKVEMKFVGILDYTESTLADFGQKIAASNVGKAQIQKAFNSYNNRGDFYNTARDLFSDGMFFWINDKKKMLMSSEYGYFKVPLDLSARDYLKNTQENPWKAYTGAPIAGAASGQYVIPVGVGVANARGKNLGTIAVGFRVPILVEKLGRLSMRQRVDFALLDTNNRVIAESVSGLFSADPILQKNLKNSQDDSTTQVVEEFELFDSKGSFVVARNVEKYPYKILIGLSNESVNKGVQKEIKPHLIGLLIVTIFFGTLLFFIRGVLKN